MTRSDVSDDGCLMQVWCRQTDGRAEQVCGQLQIKIYFKITAPPSQPSPSPPPTAESLRGRQKQYSLRFLVGVAIGVVNCSRIISGVGIYIERRFCNVWVLERKN